MDISTLRSSLQHACPELRNLTSSELQEAKWLTKRKVFHELIANAATLAEEREKLIDLIELRNEESALQKRTGCSREERIEAESTFRTKFMRTVLDGLTKLKWPPSQEAFSDPLDSLFSDPSVFLDAVKFLLRVAVPIPQELSFRAQPSNPGAENRTPPKRPSSSGNTSDVSFASAMSRIPQEDSYLGGPLEVSRGPNLSTIDEDSSHHSYAPPPPSSRGHETSAYTSAPSSMYSRDHKLVVNWKAFEVMQRQNEVLSARLRELQLSVLKRDETEAKIAGILTELKSTVSEIVEAGGGRLQKAAAGRDGGSVVKSLDPALAIATSATAAGNTFKGLKDGVSEQEMEEYRREVEREQAELASKKDTTLGATVAGSSAKASGSGKAGGRSAAGVAGPALCANCSAKIGHTAVKAATPTFAAERDSTSSSVMWSKVYLRLQAMEEQWGSAQRTSRRLAEGSVHSSAFGGHSSPPAAHGRPRKSPGGGSSGGGGLSRGDVRYSAAMTPSKDLVHDTLGVHPALPRGVALAGEGDRDLFASPPQPPGASGISGHYGDGAGSAGASGLDLGRLHQLQRDLVAFSERAFTLTSSTAQPADADTSQVHASSNPLWSEPSALPGSTAAAKRQEDVLALQCAAWDLVLHLSSIAPAAPLALRSCYRSCVTGLEALLHEIAENVNPKLPKATQLRLQTACDRALSEQVAVVRCLREARSCLHQWTQHAASAGPALRGLGKKFRATVEATARELDDRASALAQVSEAMDAAERARVPPFRTSTSDGAGLDMTTTSRHSASGRSAALVCPLESLARGAAGKEVAALVNALRTYSTELDSSAQEVRALGNKLAAELRRELEGLSHTETSIEYAAEATTAVLSAPLPGAGSIGDTANDSKAGSVGHAGKSKGTGAGVAGGVKRVSAAGAQLGSGRGQATGGDLGARPPFDLSLS